MVEKNKNFTQRHKRAAEKKEYIDVSFAGNA